MPPEHHNATMVLAVRYAMRVLENVDRHGDGVTDAQLAARLDLPPDDTAQLLAALLRDGYLRQQADGRYVLGSSAVLLGGSHRKQALSERMRSVLARLRDEVGAAVYFGRYDDGEVRVVDCADSPSTPRVNEWVDFRYAAHASAIGKCLLTQLDLDRRRDHVARHKPARLTSKTITSEKALFAELDSRPPTVPALDLQEYAVGTVCAAVPVTVGSQAGCLAVSMPLEHAHRLREAAETLNRRAAPVLLSLTI